MRVRLDDATAEQLREFYRTEYAAQIHDTASRKTVLAKLEGAGFAGDAIEVPDAPAVRQDAGHEPQVDATTEAEKAVKALMDAGWGEAEARRMCGFPDGGGRPVDAQGEASIERRLVEMGYSRKAAHRVAPMTSHRQLDALPDDAAQHWVTIHVQPSNSEENEPPRQFTSVNGRAQFIPRGQDAEVRVPFLNVLLDAEKFVYDQVEEPDGLRRSLKRRVVEQYPVTFVSAPRASRTAAHQPDMA